MKKARRLFFGILLFFILACGSTTAGGNSSTGGVDVPPEGNGDSGGGGNPIIGSGGGEDPVASPRSNPQGGIGSSGGNNDSTDINIPPYNESAPNGILEQLAWSATGGGGLTEPCGECSIELEDSSLIMSNFHGSQRLNLLVYRYTGVNECGEGTAEYVTSLSLQVDDNGYLSSTLSGPTKDLFVIMAVDLDTNEMVWHTWRAKYHNNACPLASTSLGECQGAPPQRLEVNQMAYVCTASDSVKLRDGPDKDYPVLKSLIPGADLKVIGGPVCADNWSWWQVETESGYKGWMSEGGDNTDPYFLCPR